MKRILKRISFYIIRKLRTAGFVKNLRQVVSYNPEAGKPVLIVSAGNLSIPPSGWGAVERIISETVPYLALEFKSIMVLNSKHWRDWRRVSKNDVSVILCHDDATLKRARKWFPNVPIVAISHYGYLGMPNKWHRSYKKVFDNLIFADALVALSNQCQAILKLYFPEKKIFLAPNGIETFNFTQHTQRKRIAYVGKIESRKRQIEIARKFPNLPIDFIGPFQDKEIQNGVQALPGAARFLGNKNEEWLRENLGSYEIGMLMSESEADALVLYEYQAAGLKVLASQGAIGSQNSALPWIRIASLSNLEIQLIALRQDKTAPSEIADYSRKNYCWSDRIEPYIAAIKFVAK